MMLLAMGDKDVTSKKPQSSTGSTETKRKRYLLS